LLLVAWKAPAEVVGNGAVLVASKTRHSAFETIMIPLFHGMTEEEQAHVIAALKSLPV
jgi:dTDP-4-amino-4,6-dideoxygalactose transaminase